MERVLTLKAMMCKSEFYFSVGSEVRRNRTLTGWSRSVTIRFIYSSDRCRAGSPPGSTPGETVRGIEGAYPRRSNAVRSPARLGHPRARISPERNHARAPDALCDHHDYACVARPFYLRSFLVTAPDLTNRCRPRHYVSLFRRGSFSLVVLPCRGLFFFGSTPSAARFYGVRGTRDRRTIPGAVWKI